MSLLNVLRALLVGWLLAYAIIVLVVVVLKVLLKYEEWQLRRMKERAVKSSARRLTAEAEGFLLDARLDELHRHRDEELDEWYRQRNEKKGDDE